MTHVSIACIKQLGDKNDTICYQYSIARKELIKIVVQLKKCSRIQSLLKQSGKYPISLS